MKRILGLDLGTNSIGWAVVDNENQHIEAAGSRIIPMDAGRLGDFEKGNSISFTADRTKKRGTRRLYERRILRRERLLRVLKIMGFLPEHYTSQLTRYGKFNKNTEPKLAWREGRDRKTEFLFKSSFEEMIKDFREKGITQKIPYDWTIYFLRKKALTKPITKEELAWILLQFNQKRGYNQLRGKLDEFSTGDESDKKEEKEYHELRIIKVENSGEKDQKGNIWFNFVLENGWIYRRALKKEPDWQDKIRPFIATFKLDKDGTRKEEQPSLSSPKEDDWGLRKIQTQQSIDQSNLTVGEYIYSLLLKKPSQKIIGEAVRTIDRHYYIEELHRIIKKQTEFIPELQDKNLYQQCIESLYATNEAYRNSIANRDFTYLLSDDILFYQRPLKSKRSLIANCRYEHYSDGHPIKCIAKSHPLYQEFRLWQFLVNLRIYCDDIDITSSILPDKDAYANLYEALAVQKSINQSSLLKILNIGKKELVKYRWNYVDKDYPVGETRAILSGGLRKAGIDVQFLSSDKEFQL